MDFDEYNLKLDKVIQQMSGDANGKLMVEIGSDALATIRKRILTTGVDAMGAPYSPYSTRPLLANCSSMSSAVCTSVAGSKEKRRELKWVTIKGHKLFELPGGYKQYRELHGKQTGFVDFSFSGRMWANIAIVSNFSEHVSGVVRIAAKAQENKDKLSGNTKRRGDILALSHNEIAKLSEDYNMGIVQIFKKQGL